MFNQVDTVIHAQGFALDAIMSLTCHWDLGNELSHVYADVAWLRCMHVD